MWLLHGAGQQGAPATCAHRAIARTSFYLLRLTTQGRPHRSVLGRERVTQTVRPRLSRGGSLSAGTMGSPAAAQPAAPPSSVSAATPSCRSQAAAPWLSLAPLRQITTAYLPAVLSSP